MLTLIISIIIATTLFNLFIEYLNYRNWSPKVPKQLKGFIKKDKYKKSQAYNKESQKFDFLTTIIDTAIILVALGLGLFGWLDSYITTNFTDNSTLVTLLFFAICYVIHDIIMLPFEIYETFIIEQKYGFNKTTPKIFVMDKLKGYILTALIGGIVLYLFKLYYDFAGDRFWFYAWVTITLISILFSAFYTNLIVPIFNKLTPLKDGELRSEIENYASKVKFPLDRILVMDASKRSTKGNAFFNGLFGKKNIVLFDTIIEKHPKEELVAVLAHEVGHFKKKHTLKIILASIIQTGIMLYLLGTFINNPAFSEALGSSDIKFHLGLIAFTILYSPISLIIGAITNLITRKHEFEADKYSKETYSGKALADALKRLSIDNLSNLNPHPAYVFLNYSHPPVLHRIKRLEVEN